MSDYTTRIPVPRRTRLSALVRCACVISVDLPGVGVCYQFSNRYLPLAGASSGQAAGKTSACGVI